MGRIPDGPLTREMWGELAVTLTGFAYVQPHKPMLGGSGMSWIPSDVEAWKAGGSGDPVPDMHSPAVGGLLLHHLGHDLDYCTRSEGGWTVYTVDGKPHNSPYLAVACAMAAEHMQRWAGGVE